MRINYDKQFVQDKDFELRFDAPYKSMRYIRKLIMRNSCAQLKAQKLLRDKEYQGMEVWDLKYISTSDEEDNDSSETSSSNEEDSLFLHVEQWHTG